MKKETRRGVIDWLKIIFLIILIISALLPYLKGWINLEVFIVCFIMMVGILLGFVWLHELYTRNEKIKKEVEVSRKNLEKRKIKSLGKELLAFLETFKELFGYDLNNMPRDCDLDGIIKKTRKSYRNKQPIYEALNNISKNYINSRVEFDHHELLTDTLDNIIHSANTSAIYISKVGNEIKELKKAIKDKNIKLLDDNLREKYVSLFYKYNAFAKSYTVFLKILHQKYNEEYFKEYEKEITGYVKTIPIPFDWKKKFGMRI